MFQRVLHRQFSSSIEESKHTVVGFHGVDARSWQSLIPLFSDLVISSALQHGCTGDTYTYWMTGKQQYKGKHQLIAHNGHNGHDQDRVVRLHEPPDTDIRRQQGDFKAKQGHGVNRTASILQLSIGMISMQDNICDSHATYLAERNDIRIWEILCVQP